MSSEAIEALVEKEQEARSRLKYRVSVCSAAGCLSSQGQEVRDSLKKAVQERKLGDSIRVTGTGCLGLCDAGPLVQVEAGSSGACCLYGHVRPDDVAEVVSEHLEGDRPVERLRCPLDQPFFSRQQKIVLENAGNIDPESINDALAVGGYDALFTAITEREPAEIVRMVTESGLRGRGGGGYPTGLKWGTVLKARGTRKYVICNADEGDPGAFMDRSILEGDPHRVLEGMAIAAYAVGADQGYIYVRGEYPLAIERLKKAIRQAERLQLLGNRIFESGFNFRIDIRIGAGAFVCGEETALIASIEGNRGVPRPRPPYPAMLGLEGQPTLINNVETFANVAPIVARGAEWFAGIGTERSKGTKVFALAGKIEHTGLIEVPMGITLREIVFDIGGGIPEGRSFKAAQTGGPSGGCIPADYLDLPVDYESLARVESIMGSGGLIVMDETSCMVDVAKFFVEFCRDESCGKCIPCRAGTVQMHKILQRITDGEATLQDLNLLEQLCGLLKDTSLCGLGQTAPNPVVSTLKFFRHEYMAHINERRCPAGVCRLGKQPLTSSAAGVEERA
jgi:bidirectional [NiFe] hydrogenase diaphorase subunit